MNKFHQVEKITAHTERSRSIKRLSKLTLFLVSIYSLAAAPLNRDAINDHVGAFKAQQARNAAIHNASFKAGACVAGAFAAHALYTYFFKGAPVSGAAACEHALSDADKKFIQCAIDFGKNQQNSWWNSTPAWLGKTVATAICQSMVFQGLEPFYSGIKHYVLQEMVLPVNHFWFLSHLHKPVDGDKRIKVSKGLGHFIMHTQALEVAYQEHHGALLRESAEYILGHILYSKDQAPPYQKFMAEKISKKLEQVFQEMLDDAEMQLYDADRLETCKEIIGQLRIINIYYIS